MSKPSEPSTANDRDVFVSACLTVTRFAAGWAFDRMSPRPNAPRRGGAADGDARSQVGGKLTEVEAAAYCRVTKGTIARWRKHGATSGDDTFALTLPCSYAGRRPRYTKAQLDRFMAAIGRNRRK